MLILGIAVILFPRCMSRLSRRRWNDRAVFERADDAASRHAVTGEYQNYLGQRRRC